MVSSLASQLRSTLWPPTPGLGAFYFPLGCFVTRGHATAQPPTVWGVLTSVAPTASVTRTRGKDRVSRLALRSHYWGVLVVVVASGDLNSEGAELLGRYLRRVQLDNDVVVDLWDVTRCEAEGIAV